MARHIFSEMTVLKRAQPKSRQAAKSASGGLHRKEVCCGQKYRGRQRIEIESVVDRLRGLVELVDCKR